MITFIAVSFPVSAAGSTAANIPKPKPDQRCRCQKPPELRRQNQGQQYEQPQQNGDQPPETTTSSAHKKRPPRCELNTAYAGDIIRIHLRQHRTIRHRRLLENLRPDFVTFS